MDKGGGIRSNLERKTKAVNQQNNYQQLEFRIDETPDDVAATAVDLILEAANQAINVRGIFRIVLAGGTTPEKVYRLLVNQECNWNQWHFYLGDERCLPENHEDRNSQMLQRTLFDSISINPHNIHLIPAELGAMVAAEQYSTDIKDSLPFDMVLLGMGEDGHTASLFPGHEYASDQIAYAVSKSPKPPPERITLSVDTLSKNENLLILITGKAKQEAFNKWKAGVDLPIAHISSLGLGIVLMDKSLKM